MIDQTERSPSEDPRFRAMRFVFRDEVAAERRAGADRWLIEEIFNQSPIGRLVAECHEDYERGTYPASKSHLHAMHRVVADFALQRSRYADARDNGRLYDLAERRFSRALADLGVEHSVPAEVVDRLHDALDAQLEAGGSDFLPTFERPGERELVRVLKLPTHREP